jgi:hypothetical protein
MIASLLEHGQKDVAESLIHFQATIFKTELSMSRQLDVGYRGPHASPCQMRDG